MQPKIRILMLEDDRQDATLIEEELRHNGLDITVLRVDTREDFEGSLRSFLPDVILSDFSLPGFDGLSALGIAVQSLPRVPFIFVSGTIGEEQAIEALKRGATDYVLKDRPARLGSSVRRALREAEERNDLRRTEEEWRKSRELFKLMTDNVADLIAVVDLGGRLLYANIAYRAILGIPDAYEGLDAFHNILSEDAGNVRRTFLDIVKTGLGRRLDFRLLAKDNTTRYVESIGSVIKEPEGTVSKVVFVSRDVTDRKAAEKEKERLEDQLRQAQKMETVGTLAGGIAHDFNNILGIILGYGSLLMSRQVPALDITRAAGHINKAAQRGSVLVRQLMTFARKAGVVFEPVQVNSVIHEMTGMLGATLPKTITCSMDLGASLPVLIADGGQMYQALLNICLNARDAMPRGGTISIKTDLVEGKELKERQAENFPYVGIHIRDTGMGMDAAIRSRIFEPFFTTKEPGKGTGLGLAMVYGVVRGHEGFIDVDSVPGHGTTFHLYFPVKQRAVSKTPKVEVSQNPGFGHETLLIVEDEEMLLELLEKMLAARGYRILTARTGREAVEVYENNVHSIDVVVSDLGLPELAGDKAFQMMKEINPRVKAILATGYAEEEAKEEMIRSGVFRIIQKPYVIGEIVTAIRSAVDVLAGTR